MAVVSQTLKTAAAATSEEEAHTKSLKRSLGPSRRDIILYKCVLDPRGKANDCFIFSFCTSPSNPSRNSELRNGIGKSDFNERP